MNNKIPAEGTLKHYNFQQILAYINEEKKTGILTIEDKNVKKSIYIENGYIISASSNEDIDRLGELLIKTGKITPELRDESVKLSKKTGRRQGIILIESGNLAPKDLFYELKQQIKQIVLGLFPWEDGTFSFKETDIPPEIIKIKIKIESLIHEGINRKETKKKEKDNVFIQKVNELYKNINRLNYYDILEINSNVTLSEIKKSYFKMVKDYHPDSHPDLEDTDLKDKLTVILGFINKAYQILSNETKRAKYDATFINIKNVSKKTPRNDTVKAEGHFKRGVEEFNQGNFWGAVDFLRWATRINPQKAKYWVYLSSALSKIPRRGKEAEEAILKAIELEPYNSKYYVHLGTIYLQAGMKKRATHQFETALSWDPTNTKALRELEKLKGNK